MEVINYLVKETDGALIMGYFNAQHAQKGESIMLSEKLQEPEKLAECSHV